MNLERRQREKVEARVPESRSMPLRNNNPWMVCRRRKPHAVVRLLCFPYAGGGASVYRDWTDCLPETVEVWSIQYPGRESRINETPFTCLPALAQGICQATEYFCEKPFALYGHSLGALLSLEVARGFRRNMKALPVCVYVSGCSAPHVPDPDPPIHALPEPEFLEKLRAFNGTPEAVLQDPELRKIFLPTLRADFTLRETYAYNAESPLDCPIVAFGGMNDPEVNRDDLEAWKEHTSSSFQLSMFPGDHFFLHTSKHDLLQQVSLNLTHCVQSLASQSHSTLTLEVSS